MRPALWFEVDNEKYVHLNREDTDADNEKLIEEFDRIYTAVYGDGELAKLSTEDKWKNLKRTPLHVGNAVFGSNRSRIYNFAFFNDDSAPSNMIYIHLCLLYTSDAADD